MSKHIQAISQLALGACATLLQSIVRGWDMHKPVLLAPSLSDDERQNELTKIQLRSLKNDYNIQHELTVRLIRL